MVKTPFAVASVALGLVAAGVGLVVSAIARTWIGWPQLVILVLVAGVFGVGQRAAFARGEGKSMVAAGVWSWLASVFGSAFCFGVVGLVSALTDRSVIANELAAFALVGAMIGMVLGFFLLPIFLALRAACTRPLIDVFDRVLVASAVLVGFAAGGAIAVEAELLAGYGGFVILGVAAAMFVLASYKTWIRARWLHAVLRKEVTSWAVIDPFDGDDQLPAIGVRLKDRAVLATGNFSGGPFRAGGAVSPVARVDRAGGYMQLPYIAVACALVTLAVMPIALWRRAVVGEHTPFDLTIEKPLHFASLGPTDDLVVGPDVVCAHLAGGNYKCWGSDAGWLVPGMWSSVRTPTTSNVIHGAQAFFGHGEVCVLPSVPGTARCFTAGPPPMPGPAGARALAFGADFQLALAADGTVTRTGTESGTLDVPPVIAVAARNVLACVLTREGAVYCAGQTSSSTPEPLHPVSGFSGAVDQIVVREGDAWARVTTPNGKHRWFAWNAGDAVSQPAWDDVAQMAGDAFSVCGLRVDGSVHCAEGETAVVNPDRLARPLGSPVQVLPAGSALQIAGGWRTICARGRTDAWCWDGL